MICGFIMFFLIKTTRSTFVVFIYGTLVLLYFKASNFIRNYF